MMTMMTIMVIMYDGETMMSSIMTIAMMTMITMIMIMMMMKMIMLTLAMLLFAAEHKVLLIKNDTIISKKIILFEPSSSCCFNYTYNLVKLLRCATTYSTKRRIFRLYTTILIIVVLLLCLY